MEVREVITGKRVLSLDAGHPYPDIAFSPTGGNVATSALCGTVLSWDIRNGAGKPPEDSWTALAGDNAEIAHEAMAQMAREEDRTMDLLKKRLLPVLSGDRRAWGLIRHTSGLDASK